MIKPDFHQTAKTFIDAALSAHDNNLPSFDAILEQLSDSLSKGLITQSEFELISYLIKKLKQ